MSEDTIDQSAIDSTNQDQHEGEQPNAELEQDQESVELTPEEKEAKAKEDAEKRHRSAQERINKSVAKQREAERRAALAEEKLREYEEKANPLKEPNIADFEDLADYLKAEREYGAKMAQKEFQKGQSQNTQQADTQALVQTYKTREAELAATIPDYNEVIRAADEIIGEAGLPRDVSIALLRNPQGARIGYELSKDTDQLIDFLSLSPTDQLIRIGEISASLPKQHSGQPGAATARVPPAATQPKPITPVQANASAKKDPYKMSDKDFLASKGLR